MVTVLTVMLLYVLVFKVGVVTAAPLPRAIVVPVTDPVRVIAVVAPVTLAAGILVGNVILIEPAVVGVPVMVMVTTVLLVRTAAAAESPAGKPDDMAKLAAVIDVA